MNFAPNPRIRNKCQIVSQKVGGKKTISFLLDSRQTSIPVTRPTIYIQIGNILGNHFAPILVENSLEILPHIKVNSIREFLSEDRIMLALSSARYRVPTETQMVGTSYRALEVVSYPLFFRGKITSVLSELKNVISSYSVVKKVL